MTPYTHLRFAGTSRSLDFAIVKLHEVHTHTHTHQNMTNVEEENDMTTCAATQRKMAES